MFSPDDLNMSKEESLSVVNGLFEQCMESKDQQVRQLFVDICFSMNGLALIELSLLSGINYLAALDPKSDRNKLQITAKVLETLLELRDEEEHHVWLSLIPFLPIKDEEYLSIVKWMAEQFQTFSEQGSGFGKLSVDELCKIEIHPSCQQNLLRFVQFYIYYQKKIEADDCDGSYLFKHLLEMISLQEKPTDCYKGIFTSHILNGSAEFTLIFYSKEMVGLWIQVRKDIQSRPDYSANHLLRLLAVELKGTHLDAEYYDLFEEDMLSMLRLDFSQCSSYAFRRGLVRG
jgi:hypothetical protein